MENPSTLDQLLQQKQKAGAAGPTGRESLDIYGRRGERWGLVERFPLTERGAAMARAQELDASDNYGGIRVMEVTYSARSGKALESLAWISPKADRRQAVKRGGAAGGGGRPAQDGDVASISAEGQTEAIVDGYGGTAPGQPPAENPEEGLSTAKFSALLLVGGVLVGLLGFGGMALFGEGAGGGPIDANLLRVGLIVAGGFALIVIAYFVRSALIRSRQTARIDAAPARPQASENTSEQHYPDPGKAPTLAEQAEELKADLETEAADDEEPDFSPSGFGDEETSQVSHDNRLTMIRFLEGAISAIKDQITKLDAHNTFGINLFLAGSGHAFADHLGLGGMQRHALVRGALEALGTKTEGVDVLLAKFDEFATEPRNKVMIEAGAKAMTLFLVDDEEAFVEFPRVMRTWNDKAAMAAQQGGIVVIMFTDLVGSTKMTAEVGDHGAQKVVRAHNAIVRSALAHYGGKEVKHTGDGIMASFNHGPRAVKATIRIQRDLARHNASHPNLPVNVRIGLNAGEAIEEEDDFYGQTVQLSARVCDKADTAEIYVTDSVKGLCEGQGVDFADQGQFELKGIDEPMTLFAIDWRAHP
ncbi:MAG: adenylate/guanylate cyclase domain-containing protein [Magnetovibrionaceae bacterium]